jgi:hypothetical protein
VSGRSLPAFILQRDTGDSAGQALANQPRNPESGLIVAKPRTVDVGDAIALGIGAAWLRRKGQIRAQTIRGGKARPLANQHGNHAGPENGADFVAQGDPRPRCNHGMADFDSVASQLRNQAPDNLDGVSIDRRRRQAVADNDRKPARAADTTREQMLRRLIERSSEVGTPQIFLPVACAAADIKCLETKIVEA